MITNKTIHNWGINDLRGKYHINFSECPIYNTWKKMIGRCYDPKYHETRPSYIGCTVCEEWRYFSVFKTWMEQQDWKGKQLDKDFLKEGNKQYCPDYCIFISKSLNCFLTNCGGQRGEFPLGVSWSKFHKKFRAYCSNGSGKNISLGFFDNPEDGHIAWKNKKHEIAVMLSSEVKDERLKQVLLTRFL